MIEGVFYEVNPRLRMNGTLNLVATRYASNYKTIHFLGDDHMVRTKGWDELDLEQAKKEFDKTLKSINLNMTQTEFQTEVGRLEVLGELLIKNS